MEDTGEVAPEAAPVEDTDDTVVSTVDEEEEDDGLKPLSDRLVMELTAHRTLALRNALAQDPQVAFLAALHAMVLRLFYRYAVDSCVEIEPRNAAFGSQVPGLGDTSYAQAIDQRHETWARNLPKASEDLWEALTEFDSCSREALFAHCVAMSVNAVHDPYQRRPRAIAHAEMCWPRPSGSTWPRRAGRPRGDSYLARVTKARILEAVREAKGEDAADRIAGLKKAEMVTASEDLLSGTNWLPDPLRTPPLPEEDAPEIELIDNADGAGDDASEDDPDSGEAQTAEDDGEPAIGRFGTLEGGGSMIPSPVTPSPGLPPSALFEQVGAPSPRVPAAGVRQKWRAPFSIHDRSLDRACTAPPPTSPAALPKMPRPSCKVRLPVGHPVCWL